MLLDASFMCGCGSTRGNTCGSEAVWPTRVQQAEREHVAEEEVPGSPLDGERVVGAPGQPSQMDCGATKILENLPEFVKVFTPSFRLPYRLEAFSCCDCHVLRQCKLQVAVPFGGSLLL